MFIITIDDLFQAEGLAELGKVVVDPVAHPLGGGAWLIETDVDFWVAAERWVQSPPIFIRHVHPVQLQCPVSSDESDLAELVTAVTNLVPVIDPSASFSVQARLLGSFPYRKYLVNTTLSDYIEAETSALLDTKQPEQILSVTLTADTAYIGISLAPYNLSNWAGGVHRFAKEPAQISRAEFKLLEALEVFGIVLPANGLALDLGAAPGGWTRILRQKEQWVTAVDPAFLHPSLRADKGVRHKRFTAEEYLDDDPDQFDLIVNDMRMDARDSARLMAAYAYCLYQHGDAIMTFKLPEKQRQNVLDHAFTILQTKYTIVGVRNLYHNRSEITLHLKKNKTG